MCHHCHSPRRGHRVPPQLRQEIGGRPRGLRRDVLGPAPPRASAGDIRQPDRLGPSDYAPVCLKLADVENRTPGSSPTCSSRKEAPPQSDTTGFSVDPANLDELSSFPFVFTNDLTAIVDPKALDNLKEYLQRGGFFYVEGCVDHRVTRSFTTYLAHPSGALHQIGPWVRGPPAPAQPPDCPGLFSGGGEESRPHRRRDRRSPVGERAPSALWDLLAEPGWSRSSASSISSARAHQAAENPLLRPADLQHLCLRDDALTGKIGCSKNMASSLQHSSGCPWLRGDFPEGKPGT